MRAGTLYLSCLLRVDVREGDVPDLDILVRPLVEQLGAANLSGDILWEDRVGLDGLDFDLSVRRIDAARRAIDRSGTRVLLTGRSEGFVYGRPDIDETIRRLEAYAEAGADCLYAPRIDDLEHVSAIVAAVSPKPVNLLINAPFTTVAEAAQLGVRRISVGGTLARTAWGGFLEAAEEIAASGTFSRFQGLPDVEARFG